MHPGEAASIEQTVLCACWKNEVKKGKEVINIKKRVHLFSTQHATCSTVRLIGSGLHDSKLSLNPGIPRQERFFELTE